MRILLLISLLFLVTQNSFSVVNLISPPNNFRCQDYAVEFSWEPYQGTVRSYTLKVSTYPDLSNPILDTSNLTTTSIIITLPGANVQYYWRVLAVISQQPPPEVDSSAVWTFTTMPYPPSTIEPQSNSQCNSTNVRFRWSTVNNVQNYRVQISNSEWFLTLIKDTLVTSNEAIIKVPNWETKYYWRVLANTNYGCTTYFSIVDSFKTKKAPPTPTQPADSISSVWGAVTFTWDVPVNANSYNLQISSQPDFGVILYDEITLIKTVTKVITDYNTRFYWRVKAVYPDCETDFSKTRTFRTAYAPPQNLYPPKDTFCHSNNVLFKWDAVSGASSYRLQVTEGDTLNLSNIVLDTLINARQFTHYFGKSLQSYCWRVRAEDKQNIGLWCTDTMRFQTTFAPPKHLSPSNNEETSITVKFAWSKDIPGSIFDLQVSDTNNFNLIQHRIYDYSGLTKDTIVLKLPKFNKKYFWRVRVFDSYCRSDWSTPTYFTTKLQKPTLIFPSNNSTKMPLKINFEWTKPEGWQSFDIHISKDPQFASIYTGRSGIITNSVTISDFEPQTQYYWRVRAINNQDTSRWSNVFVFTTGSNPLEIPTLIYPTNDGENLPVNVTLVWNKVPKARYYQLQVSEDLQFNQKTYDVVNISDTFHLISDLKPMAEYFWRVLAYNDSTSSAWSNIWRFRTAPPVPKGPVYLSIPPNESKGVDVTLSLIWSPIQYAEFYHLQVATDENFEEQNLIVNDSNLIMPNKYLTRLNYETKYYWHVRGYNPAGSTPWSETWWFITMVSSVEDEVAPFFVAFSPGEKVLKINFLDAFLSDVKIQIFDVFGRIYYSSSNQANQNSFVIPCKEISNGLYFIKIIAKDKIYFAKVLL